MSSTKKKMNSDSNNNNNRMPKVMLNYRPNGRRRLGRLLKRLLDDIETCLPRCNAWRMKTRRRTRNGGADENDLQRQAFQAESLLLDSSKFPVDAGFLRDEASFPTAGVRYTTNCTPCINHITQARAKEASDSYMGRHPVPISVVIPTSLPVLWFSSVTSSKYLLFPKLGYTCFIQYPLKLSLRYHLIT